MHDPHFHYGKLLSQHPHNTVKDWNRISGAVFGFVLLVGIPLFFNAIDAIDELPLELILLLFFMVFLIPTLFFVGAYRLWTKPSLNIHERGLLYTERNQTRFIPWNAIDDIRAFMPADNQYGKFGLYANNKRLLLINDRFQRTGAVVHYILDTLCREKDYQARFESGETLSAGKLKVNHKEIRLNRRVIAWEQVRDVQQAGHMTQIVITYNRNKSAKLGIRQQPNAPLLFYFMSKQSQAPLMPTTVNFADEAPIPTSATAETSIILKTDLVKWKPLIMILIALIGIGGGFYIIVPSVINGIEWGFINFQWYLWGAVSLIIPLMGLTILFINVKLLINNPRLILSKRGITQTTNSGDTHWNWQELDFAHYKIFWGLKMYAGYKFYTDSDDGLLLDGRYTNFGNFAEMFQDYHHDAVYAQYKRRLDRGERLNFGVVEIDQIGVYFANRAYNWNDINSYDVTNISTETHLILYGYQQRRLIAVTIFRLRNPHILKSLVAYKLNQSPKF